MQLGKSASGTIDIAHEPPDSTKQERHKIKNFIKHLKISSSSGINLDAKDDPKKSNEHSVENYLKGISLITMPIACLPQQKINVVVTPKRNMES